MRIIKVLIASPSDVEPERKIAEAVIRDWNTRHKMNADDTVLLLRPLKLKIINLIAKSGFAGNAN
ncbi:MAG: hypothetical protein HGB06_10545 [Chlorobaculum sp.]|jgi:hypothetical protein|nr:hypothetical protein [Chlorobaculum sp.]